MPTTLKIHSNMRWHLISEVPLRMNGITLDKSINEDVAGLGLIMVAAVKAKAKETMKAITKLKVSRPELRIALNDCSDRYNAILVGDVPEAEQALRGNPKFAENGMADSSIEAVACEENFKKVKSPLTGFNNKMRDLSDVARAIIRNLL
ncbi:cell wall / vacuolar inhibitor of fructosidase 1-like [Olea europaea var. sylvestris]|uniref:cell wall / vacuolar inhibitor of fructosidase 1-like n=1 Tax=Olea europaea var. sylvestris TaxID=158386 RepID=UPI000C1D687A|nr:cell wall / vacuolar inhibitor of fructosidase 1-like [Olea europaea var. sylvestris]